MRMKDYYMRNGQLKPGYNVQIDVESKENYLYVENNGQIPYIKPKTYEK
jgi:hypothetical protein